MSTTLCRDHDADCPSIFAEGGALDCWLYDPTKGFCPYLRSTKEPERQVELSDQPNAEQP